MPRNLMRTQPNPPEGADGEAKAGKSALKRRRIIEAAARVFASRGYAHATLSEIAASAGTQAGSLYYYFASREDLVEEMLTEGTRRLSNRVKAALAALPSQANELERFVTMVRTHVIVTCERDEFVIAYQKIHDQVTDEMRANISLEERAFGRFWTSIFKRAVKQGFIRADLDARLTRLLLVGSIYWMPDWYKREGPSSAEEIADAAVRLFLEGAAVDDRQMSARLGSPKRGQQPRRKFAAVAG